MSNLQHLTEKESSCFVLLWPATLSNTDVRCVGTNLMRCSLPWGASAAVWFSPLWRCRLPYDGSGKYPR